MKSLHHKKNSRVILNVVKNLLHQRFLASLGMTVIIGGIAFVLIAPGFYFPVYAQNQNFAQQPCYSDRGGYCMKIVAPKISPGRETTSFAAGIVGLEFLGESANLGDLLARIYYFLLSLVGISALVMFVWGGIEYMLAGDKDPGKAKERMKNAVYGLVLALTSYLILYTINPDLVSRLDINLDPIAPQQRTEPPPQVDF